MFCTNCGSDNPADAAFCEQCGRRLELVCPACNALASPGARFCKKCGASLNATSAQSAPIAARSSSGAGTRLLTAHTVANVTDGERKTVTALFADIRGSTELLERLDAEEASALIDPALKLMIEAVNHYDGYIVQSTGDGIFALFGAPAAHEDHPQRALYAALRLQDQLQRYAASLRARGGSPIEARVGINTGEVVVRSIRTGEGHSEYAPVGHTANLASRMQTIAASGGIVVTDNTRPLVEGYFILRSLGQVTLRGIAEPVNAYEVLGLGPLRTRLQRAAGRGLTKFVGRETELAQMKRALELTKVGHGQIVAAIGEPGVGKSRLFYEFKAVSQAGSLVLEAYSVSHGKASAYLPVTEMLRDYFRIVPEDDALQRREKVAGKIVILDRMLVDTLPYFYALLGVAESDRSITQMDVEIRRRRTYDAIKRVLWRESLKQPLIVIFEDLHWIDSDTQGLLDALGDSIASARVLLLVNYRPEYRHEWSGRTYYTQLRLDPLGHDGADEMLTALLGDASELEGLRRAIAARTEGNPFFIEEIVQGLFEEGVLTHNGGVKLARSFSESRLPTTVQGILSARIDRLRSNEKELLQTLAAIGREFPLSLAKRVTNCSDEELEPMLARLQNGEFIYEQPAAGDVEYTFKHALTQEVAYNSLLIERRKLLHERIAQATENLFAEHLDDHLKDLAHHYRRSDNTLKAIEYLRRAGQQAVAHAFYEEAIEYLNGALALLQQMDPGDARDGQELAVRRALMAPLIAVSPIALMDSQLNPARMRELCQKAGESGLLARVLVYLFFVHRNVMDWEQADIFAHQAIELAEQSSDELQMFLGNFVSGCSAAEKGDYLSARQCLERACRISASSQAAIVADPSIALGLTNCIGHLVLVLWMLGYPDEARRQMERIVALLRGALDPYAHEIGIYHLVIMHCELLRDGRWSQAQAEEALTRSIQSGHYLAAPVGLVSLGRIMVAEGSCDAGIQKTVEAMLAFETTGHVALYYLFSYVAAGAHLEAHRIREGIAIVERAIANASAGGMRLFEADLYRLKGEFILSAGRPESEAELALRDAIAIARRQQAKSFELRATMGLARLLDKQGRGDEARAMLAEIYNWFTEGFDTADLKGAKALLEELTG